MHLSVISPDKEIFEGVVTSITVPGINGTFQILDNHAPIVSALEKGEAKLILDNGEEKFISLEKGFIEVLNNEVSLLIQGYEDDEEEN